MKGSVLAVPAQLLDPFYLDAVADCMATATNYTPSMDKMMLYAKFSFILVIQTGRRVGIVNSVACECPTELPFPKTGVSLPCLCLKPDCTLKQKN